MLPVKNTHLTNINKSYVNRKNYNKTQNKCMFEYNNDTIKFHET